MNRLVSRVGIVLGLFLFINIILSSFGRSYVVHKYIDYSFWLSLGLYLGFKLCIYVVRDTVQLPRTMKSNDAG